MNKTIEERAEELLKELGAFKQSIFADNPNYSDFRNNFIANDLFIIKQALLEVRNEAFEAIKEIVNEEIEEEKVIGKNAKGHLASQHYGAMMVLENLQEAIRERI